MGASLVPKLASREVLEEGFVGLLASRVLVWDEKDKEVNGKACDRKRQAKLARRKGANSALRQKL